MKSAIVTFFVVMACVAAVAASAAPTTPSKIMANQPTTSPFFPPAVSDGDHDGYLSTFDCNDDDPSVYPGAMEQANGVDDDCNGVVDNGFDTSIDSPSAGPTYLLWPRTNNVNPSEWVALDVAPRLLRTGQHFTAVWTDQGQRLRLARIRPNGTLLDDPPLQLRSPVGKADAAWTGTRLAVAYEDKSTPTTAVNLLTYDPTLGAAGTVVDVVVATSGSEPKIAWGQDRLGIVWKTPFCGGDCLRFQRFDRQGYSMSAEEVLQNSAGDASIAFSGTGIESLLGGYNVHEGSFGIAYEAYYAAKTNGDVFLTSRPLDAWGTTPTTVRVNQHDDDNSPLGANPAIAANAGSLAVSWHVAEAEGNRACTRVFSRDTLDAVQEFAPDTHAGRFGHLVWTGSEFVVANDNITGTNPPAYDVHVRRIDPSGNTHLAAGWGPYSEVNLGAGFPGGVSVHPDIANSGEVLGVLFLVEDPKGSGFGRLHFTEISHD